MEVGAAADADEHAQRAVPHTVELRNPHHVSENVLTLDMQLTGPGLYWVRLYANGELVAHRDFAVQADVTGSDRAG